MGLRKSEPVITVADWYQDRRVVMPKIVGGKKHKVRARKHVDGVAATLPDKMTLREIREKVANNGAGFTIEQMADYLGTARSTYWFWEQGKRPMPDKYRARFEALLVRHTRTADAPTNGDKAEAVPEK